MLAAKETACIMLVIRLNFLHSLRRMLSKKKNLCSNIFSWSEKSDTGNLGRILHTETAFILHLNIIDNLVG